MTAKAAFIAGKTRAVTSAVKGANEMALTHVGQNHYSETCNPGTEGDTPVWLRVRTGRNF